MIRSLPISWTHFLPSPLTFTLFQLHQLSSSFFGFLFLWIKTFVAKLIIKQNIRNYALGFMGQVHKPTGMPGDSANYRIRGWGRSPWTDVEWCLLCIAHQPSFQPQTHCTVFNHRPFVLLLLLTGLFWPQALCGC